MSYDLDSLVEDGVVRVAASRFPVVATVDSFGESPTRFAMARVPGTELGVSGAWVAVVWKSNQMGGDPIVALAEPVHRIVAFSVNSMHMILENGSTLTVTPSRGCGCGSVLKSYRGWPSARLSSVPSPAPG